MFQALGICSMGLLLIIPDGLSTADRASCNHTPIDFSFDTPSELVSRQATFGNVSLFTLKRANIWDSFFVPIF